MKTPEQISYNMRQVKNKDSKIELALRKELWGRGLRYRKNVSSVYGHPDVAFIGLKIAVFCDSEFWHGYDWENKKHEHKSNQEFWFKKIERNMQRDAEVNERLQADGWIVLRFWGKEILRKTSECCDTIERTVRERKDAIQNH